LPLKQDLHPLESSKVSKKIQVYSTPGYQGFSFSIALYYLISDGKIARNCWDFQYFLIKHNNNIYMVESFNSDIPKHIWAPSNDDILANDWVFVFDEGEIAICKT
jgi:hypothetical protein